MTLVFVYGTLRRGQHNARVLSDSVYCGMSRTESIYTMLHLGGFPAIIPALASCAGVSIVGEVYAVDDATLADLDRLEGAPDFYRREMITLPDNRDRVCIYVLNQDRGPACYPVISSGDWLQCNAA